MAVVFGRAGLREEVDHRVSQWQVTSRAVFVHLVDSPGRGVGWGGGQLFQHAV